MKFIHITTSIILLCAHIAIAQNKPSTSGVTGSTPGVVNPPKNFNASPNVSPTHYNYTRTYVPLLPYTSLGTFEQTKNLPVNVATMYLGAHSAPLLKIERNGSAFDIATVFDNRQSHTRLGYLPYALPYHSRFQDTAFTQQKNFYAGLYPAEGQTAYNKTITLSDNGTPNETQYAAGKAFVGQTRGTYTTSTINGSNEVLKIQYAGGNICKNGYYWANEIVIVKTLGQNNQVSYTFKDKTGRLLGKKVAAGGGTWLYTYYVYNEIGKLIFVVPPKAAEQLASNTCISNASKLCYSYKYDAYGNLIEKGTPDKDSTDVVIYDKFYRAVMMQTALLKVEGKMQFNIYDKLGRVCANGFYTGNKDLNYWKGIISGTTTFTNSYGVADDLTLEYYLINGFKPSLYTNAALHDCDLQVLNAYDDYNNANTFPFSTSASFNTSFSAEYSGVAGSETPTPYMFTHGKLVCSAVKINDTITFSPNSWTASEFYYDEKGRMIQTQTHRPDYEGITTTQYNFAGQVVRSIYSHNYLGVRDNVIVDNFIYDALSGRLNSTSRKIDNHPWHPIAEYQYDQLGRVKKKILGGGAERQNYTYNIRNQLIGINAAQIWDTTSYSDSMSYWSQVSFEQGFDSVRYDGTVAGYTWRTPSTRVNAYGYYYDQAGRMTAADYNEYGTGTSTVGWNHVHKDFSVSGITYDANGNMLTMNQRGYDMNYDPADMDELAYTYDVGNRLMRVEDDTSLHSPIKDFVNGNIGTTDYAYDADGNLTADANKGVTNIGYTYLDLPWEVTSDSGTIHNIYDGAGSLVMKTITDAASNTNIYRYLGPYVYKNDTLQYILHSEGRTRYLADSDLYKYDFFVKDHKGNVRTVVTADVTETVEPPTTYTAGFELLSANVEEILFNNIGIVRDGNPQGSPSDLNSGCMEGSIPDKRVAASLMLHGMAGDKFTMEAFSYFDQADSSNFGVYATPENMLESVVASLSAGVIETAGEGGTATISNLNNMLTSGNYDAYEAIKAGITNPDLPRAYLNVLVFDEELNMIEDACAVVQVGGPGNDWALLSATEVTLPANGYLIAYFSNESDLPVCIDNIITKHYKGRGLQEQLYYPHGLVVDLGQQTIEPKNKYLYEGKLLQDELGLELYDYHARQYDPQIGRFWGVDPADQYPSGYTGFGNDPANMIDPSGMLAIYANQFGGNGPDGGYARMESNRRWREMYIPPPPSLEDQNAVMAMKAEARISVMDDLMSSAFMIIPDYPVQRTLFTTPDTRGGAKGVVGDPVETMKKRLEDAEEKVAAGLCDESVPVLLKQEIEVSTGEDIDGDGEVSDGKNNNDETPKNEPNSSNDEHHLDYAIVLHDRDGAPSSGGANGHTALLIGSENDGFTYISKDGTNQNGGLSGEAKFTIENKAYGSFKEFMGSANGKKYDEALIIPVFHEVAQGMIEQMGKHVQEHYNVISQNCVQAVEQSMSQMGMRTSESMVPNKAFDYMKDNIYSNRSIYQYYER